MKKFEKYITEGKKYPSQYDAEALVELTTAIAGVYLGGATEVRKLMNKIESLRMKEWDKIFGDKSPWGIEMKKGKRKVRWDDNKAEKLGL